MSKLSVPGWRRTFFPTLPNVGSGGCAVPIVGDPEHGAKSDTFSRRGQLPGITSGEDVGAVETRRSVIPHARIEKRIDRVAVGIAGVQRLAERIGHAEADSVAEALREA